MEALKRCGVRVAGMKPVASGCEIIEGRPVNEDAVKIQTACSNRPDYDLVNPWALRDPISPNIAASREGVRIEPEPVVNAYRELARSSQAIIVEGIGGWRVPLSGSLQQRDLARLLNTPVILVVGLRLGCISHACLTAEVIAGDNIPLRGWIASHVDPEYDTATETLEYLDNALKVPMLGEFPYQQEGKGDRMDHGLDLNDLL